MTSPDRRPRRGFTLVESAIVLATLLVLIGGAATDFSRSLATAALKAQTAEFMAALRFARAESVKRGERVTVCASDPSAARPACLRPGSADWRGGWLVFVDRGERERLDPGDQVLRRQAAVSRSGGIPGTRAALSYTAAGFTTDAAAHFRFLPPGPAITGVSARLVCVSKQGRARVAREAACDS